MELVLEVEAGYRVQSAWGNIRVGAMGLNTLKSVFRPRWSALAASGLIGVLIVTHIPQEYMPRTPQGSYFDKIEHVLAYGGITLLFMLSLRWPARPGVLVAVLLGLAAVGVLDEVTQPWVNRIASTGDFIADLVGIVVVTLVFLVGKRCRRQVGSQAPSGLASGKLG